MLGEAWHESGELRAWLTQEGAWLEGLARRLRRSPDAPADAEEIAHELSALETYVANRSADRLQRIHHIGAALQHAQIMPQWIQAEVSAVSERWARLRAQAAARVRLLERAAAAAQRSEVEVDRLQQWLEAAARALDPDLPPPPAPERQVRAPLLHSDRNFTVDASRPLQSGHVRLEA